MLGLVQAEARSQEHLRLSRVGPEPKLPGRLLLLFLGHQHGTGREVEHLGIEPAPI